jgi:protein-disulfide isomerase
MDTLKKSFFDAFSPKQAFVLGLVAALLVFGTLGFVGLGVYVLRGGGNTVESANLAATDNTTGEAAAVVTPEELFKKIASEVGLNLDSFNSCLSSNKMLAKISEDQASASAAGVRGTPASFLIDASGKTKQITGGAVSYSSMKALLDQTLGNSTTATPANTADLTGALAAVSDSDYITGSGDLTIVTYTDFQCPYCQKFDATMQQIMKDFSGKVRWVLRNFPLSFHDQAEAAAEAVECAGEQGKFWEYAVKVFENQSSL